MQRQYGCRLPGQTSEMQCLPNCYPPSNPTHRSIERRRKDRRRAGRVGEKRRGRSVHSRWGWETNGSLGGQWSAACRFTEESSDKNIWLERKRERETQKQRNRELERQSDTFEREEREGEMAEKRRRQPVSHAKIARRNMSRVILCLVCLHRELVMSGNVTEHSWAGFRLHSM